MAHNYLLSKSCLGTSKQLGNLAICIGQLPLSQARERWGTLGWESSRGQVLTAKCQLLKKEKLMRKQIVFLTSLLLTFTVLAACQDKGKRPSPSAQAQCKFSDGTSITIDYSSPRAKGRKIFGELVPYGEVWRTGANEATTFVTDANLSIGGQDVPAGSYTIFTIPNPNNWTLIINKKTGEWGIPYKYKDDELARVGMKASPTSSPVENFTIALTSMGNGCTLTMSWENTQASVDISEKK
jgi:hypothetical protein